MNSWLFFGLVRRRTNCQQGLRGQPCADQVEVIQILLPKTQAPFRTGSSPRSYRPSQVPQLEEPFAGQAGADSMNDGDHTDTVTGGLPEIHAKGNVLSSEHSNQWLHLA